MKHCNTAMVVILEKHNLAVFCSLQLAIILKFTVWLYLIIERVFGYRNVNKFLEYTEPNKNTLTKQEKWYDIKKI